MVALCKFSDGSVLVFSSVKLSCFAQSKTAAHRHWVHVSTAVLPLLRGEWWVVLFIVFLLSGNPIIYSCSPGPGLRSGVWLYWEVIDDLLLSSARTNLSLKLLSGPLFPASSNTMSFQPEAIFLPTAAPMGRMNFILKPMMIFFNNWRCL